MSEQDFFHLGILGWPLGHSLSPKLHQFFMGHLNLQGQYTAWPTPPDEFTNQLTTCRAQNVQGVNITLPHKVTAFHHAIKHTPQALRVGAANTLKRLPNGGWEAHNTDATGFLASLPGETRAKLSETHIVILGAGGVARAVISALLNYPVRSLTVVSRSRDRAMPVLEAASDKWRCSLNTSIQWASWNKPQIHANWRDTPMLVVNATSVGVTGEHSPAAFHPWLLICQQSGTSRLTLMDTVYQKDAQTTFCRAAAALQLSHQDGLAMLVNQGADSFAFWTGIDIDKELRERALVHLRTARSH